MSGPILLDNTVLTNLALVKQADLVPHLWGAAACTTPHVLAEYQAGVVSGLLPPTRMPRTASWRSKASSGDSYGEGSYSSVSNSSVSVMPRDSAYR